MSNEIAERYAHGLLELAQENNTVEKKKKQIEILLEGLSQSRDFEIFLRAVKVTKDEKKNMIDETFKDVVDHDVISLMKLVVDKGRSYYLLDILKQYVDLANEYLGIEIATVTSARKLTAEDLATIGGSLAGKLNKKVVLRNKVDPSVIGGIKVSVGNNITDITMANKIEKMRISLLKGGKA